MTTLDNWNVVAKRVEVCSINVFQNGDVCRRYVGELPSESVLHRPCVVVAWTPADVESGEVDAIGDAKSTQHVQRVRVERLVVSDEVVVDTAGLTEHGLRRPVEVVERLRPPVDDVLDQFGERHVIAAM